MLPELLLRILQGDSSDSSQRTDSSNDSGARLNASVSEEEIHTWFEPVEGLDYAHNAVTNVFNNPNLLSEISNFVPDPPRPPPPLPRRPENAVRRSPRLEQARGPPVRYRTWETNRGHIFSLPLYAPTHPGDKGHDTVAADWYLTDSEDDVDDYAPEDEEYFQHLDRGGDPRSYRREQREGDIL